MMLHEDVHACLFILVPSLEDISKTESKEQKKKRSAMCDALACWPTMNMSGFFRNSYGKDRTASSSGRGRNRNRGAPYSAEKKRFNPRMDTSMMSMSSSAMYGGAFVNPQFAGQSSSSFVNAGFVSSSLLQSSVGRIAFMHFFLSCVS
jgi:hypothetical protein